MQSLGKKPGLLSLGRGCNMQYLPEETGKRSLKRRGLSLPGKPPLSQSLHKGNERNIMNINKTISEIKSQAIVKDVEHAFVANLHGKEVLFVKPQGSNATAYHLPEGFTERLESARKPKRLFSLGRTVMTPGALEALAESEQQPSEFLERHQQGDWGEVDEFDWQENDLSVRGGFRILSAYRTAKDVKLWAITEADRSSTTILLPSEY
jgi:hypothetical protein